ncbi:MAG: hypothetical protein ACE5JX_09280 [Acidobacteriota bacterium]
MVGRSSTLFSAIGIGVLTLAGSAEAQVDYSLDDGTAENSIILIAGSEARPTLWLNAFEAQPGGEVITSISVTWGRTSGGASGVPAHAPTTVLLYQDDPSNDGDPRTSTLLASVVLDDGAPLSSIDTGVFLDVPIPPTTVSGTFFVAALYPDPGEGYPAPLDMTAPHQLGKSWVFSSAEDAVNVVNLGDPANFGGLIENPPYNLLGNWLLRAHGEAEGFGLAVSGSCPGPVTISVTGATPSGLVVIAYGPAGSFTVPVGPCAGLVLDITDPTLAGFFTADARGNLTLSPTPPGEACGLTLQAVDVSTCAVSDPDVL